MVDVVGLFEVQPGLLRINKDYGWLRAADVMAEGCPDLLADVAAGTHVLTEARCEAWRLEEVLWAGTRDKAALAGTLSLVREQKERIRVIVEQRKQFGFPVPDGCAAWWSGYEVHGAERPAGSCRRHSRPSTGPAPEPARASAQLRRSGRRATPGGGT